ncbi:MAG: MOSC domain-containing protein [Pseudomonadota bacterium]
MSRINQLKAHFYKPGKLEWIGLRNQREKEIIQVESAELLLEHGIAGDKAAQKPGGKRQVTLIQAEYFPVMASFLNKEKIDPSIMRRNLVVSGINLSILNKQSLNINNAILEITGNCAPCHKMEHALGYGAYNAMRNHGGVNAIVRAGGVISIGDEVSVCTECKETDPMQSK